MFSKDYIKNVVVYIYAAGGLNIKAQLNTTVTKLSPFTIIRLYNR